MLRRSALLLSLLSCLPLAHAGAQQPAPKLQPQPSPVIYQQQAPDPGWGKTGAMVGLIGSVGVVGLASVAEAINAGDGNATAVGAVAVLFSIPAVTFAALGGASVKGVPGNRGLRVGGWIAYTLGMIDAAVLIGMGASDATVPPGPTIATGLLAGLGIVCISLDAIQSANQAEAVRVRMGLPRTAIRIAPTVTAMRNANGHLAPALGFALRF